MKNTEQSQFDAELFAQLERAAWRRVADGLGAYLGKPVLVCWLGENRPEAIEGDQQCVSVIHEHHWVHPRDGFSAFDREHGYVRCAPPTHWRPLPQLPVMLVWWLSFVDGETGAFNGVCVVRGESVSHAAVNASAAGCNPGGQVLGAPMPPEVEAVFPSDKIGVLLNRDEAQALDDEIERRLTSLESS